MRTVAYSEVLAGVTDAMGWEVNEAGNPNLEEDAWHAAKRAISKGYKTIHNAADWPDLVRTELRRWYPVYDASLAISAGEFRFFPPSKKYYQALKAITGVAPAIESTPGQWETNLSSWSDAGRSVIASAFDAFKEYEVGDQVYYASDDTNYQLHTAASAGTLPTDANYWGGLSELDPRAPWAPPNAFAMGRIFAVNRRDPRKYRQPGPVPWTETVEGVQVRHPFLVEAWITFLLRPWSFTGDFYDPTITYTGDDDVIIVVPPPVVEGAVPAEFVTIAAMLASDTSTWVEARCWNDLVVGDQLKTHWFKTAEALTPNGSNILQSIDGAILSRTLQIFPEF